MTHQTSRETRDKRAASDSSGQYLDLTIPYHFSHFARDHDMDLRIGDYVRVRGLSGKYELLDVFPRFGSCRVRAIGEIECLLIPWAYLSPWKEAQEGRTSALTQAIGNWLFRGNRVYRLSEPDRVLKQTQIHWDRQTCDVEDEDGRVFCDVSWDDLEFVDDIECHFPDEPN